MSLFELDGEQFSTDKGMEALIINIQRSPNDDVRKRLFELATTHTGQYYTVPQVHDYISLPAEDIDPSITTASLCGYTPNCT